MSFLDESSTLQDALAFLDAYDDVVPGDTPPSTGIESCPSSSTGTPSSPDEKPKRMTRTKVPKVRHRHRVKAELISLRREAETLEAMLAELQTKPQVRDDRQLQIVAREFQNRKRAEITNRKLRAALARQLKLVKASEGFLHLKVAEEDLAVLYECQRAMAAPGRVLEESCIMKALAARVNQLKLNVDKHAADAGLTVEENVMFRSQRRVDQTLGPVYETASNTPLPSTMKHTEQVFWRGFVANMVTSRSPPSAVSNETSALAHVTLLYFGPDNSERQTRATLLRDARPDRVAYILSTFTPSLSEDLNCVEELMVIVRRPRVPTTTATPELPQPSSLLQTWHRVYADQQSTPPRPSAALDPRQESLLRAQSGHFGSFIQALETALLDESHEANWEKMPAICPFSVR